MRRFLLPLALFAALLPAPSIAEEFENPFAMSAEEQTSVQESLDRGLALYQYDQAAWHTTDALMEDVADPSGAGITGWVVVPDEQGWLVTYWRPEGDGYLGVYSALWDGTEVSERKVLPPEEAELSDEQVALIRAGNVPDAAQLTPCANAPFNKVIMPSGNANGSTLVYFLTPQTSLDSVPMGGHYRFEVLDGKIVDQREFTKSCLLLPIRREGQEAPKALVVTHLLDPVPTEIHVFSIFPATMPIYVITPENDKVWAVDSPGGQPRIRLVKRN